VTPRNAKSKSALIIGGSMSGLFAGLMLRRRGFEVEIYERVESELAGRGAGIVAQPVVARTLQDLGLRTADLGVEMTTRKVLDSAGALVCEIERPQTLTAWERLYRILRDGFPAAHYHRGSRASSRAAAL
jgi:2-polyprenyl-6-methoxyphenol hydroxylase-like FAD-dependent oxidoreductase